MSTISKQGASKVGLAFALAAVSSAAIVAGSPWLFPDPGEQSTFLVVWGALFTFSGVLTGISLEITRTASAVTATNPDVVSTDGASHLAAARNTAPQPPFRGPQVVWVGAVVGLVIAALVAATAPLWAAQQFALHAIPLALVVAFSAAACAGYHGTVGALAGTGRWGLYSALIAADSAVRLVLVIAVGLITRSIVAATAAAGVSFLVWLVLAALSPEARQAIQTRADAPLGTVLRRFAASAIATGSSAILVIGFPALLSLTTSQAVILANGGLLLALTLTRAPLMIPLNAFQGVAIAHFVRNQNQGIKALWPIARLALAVGIGCAILAGLVGPWLLVNIPIWGPAFWVSGPTLAGLTVGATCLALLTLTGAVCQSLARHRAFVSGWVVAVAVAVAALLLPLNISVRTIIALCLGPLVGIAIHVFALRSSSLTPTPLPDGA